MKCIIDKKTKIKFDCPEVEKCCNDCKILSDCGNICDIKMRDDDPYSYNNNFKCKHMKAEKNDIK
jgi:hypothetical protein